MDSAIQTGFKDISHTLTFRPETKERGENFAKTNRVRDATEYSCRDKEDCYFIDARVLGQASVLVTPYRTELYLDSERRVTHTFCSCVSKKSFKCKHVYALIYYIKNEESLSKTNFPQEWGKPTPLQFAKRKYSKGNDFDNMFGFKPKQPAFEPYSKLQLDKMKIHSATKHLMVGAEKMKLPCMTPVNPVLVIDPEFDKQLQECGLCLDLILERIQLHDVYGCPYTVCSEEVLEFYNQRIVKSEGEIKTLCCETIKQSESTVWFSVRRLRVSPSKKAHSIKTISKRPIESLVLEMVYPKEFSNKATRYGMRNEIVAKNEYEKAYGCKLIDVGVIVSPCQPWLCGSLDAVVVYNGCITKIVEIKCPESCEYLPINDWLTEESNLKYLILEGDEVRLRESNIYYTQCQVQMYLCGVDVCDLYVYSPCDSCCVTIERDGNFLQKVIPKCEEFYFRHYLPKLFEVISKEEEYSKNVKDNMNKLRKFTGQDRRNVI